MKSLLKCCLLVAVVGTALLFTTTKQAEARRYWAYYPAYSAYPAYGPVYTAYYPRRAVNPRRAAYYGPVVYPAPAYPVYYGPVAAPCGCN